MKQQLQDATFNTTGACNSRAPTDLSSNITLFQPSSPLIITHAAQSGNHMSQHIPSKEAQGLAIGRDSLASNESLQQQTLKPQVVGGWQMESSPSGAVGSPVGYGSQRPILWHSDQQAPKVPKIADQGVSNVDRGGKRGAIEGTESLSPLKKAKIEQDLGSQDHSDFPPSASLHGADTLHSEETAGKEGQKSGLVDDKNRDCMESAGDIAKQESLYTMKAHNEGPPDRLENELPELDCPTLTGCLRRFTRAEQVPKWTCEA